MKKKYKFMIPWLLLTVIILALAYYQYWQTLNDPEVAFRPLDSVTQETVQGGMAALPAEKTVQPEATKVQEPAQPGGAGTAVPVQDSNASDQQNKSGSIHLLLMGTDSYGSDISRTDTIIFVSADPISRHVSVISIPRDTRVDIEGIGLTKINHANVLGALEGGIHEGTLKSIQAVSNLLGVPINYYAKIDFNGFVKAVDILGGIDIILTEAIHDDNARAYFAAGTHHLTGEEALHLARARKTIRGGDFGRQKHQYQLLTALAQKVLSPAVLDKLPEMFEIVKENFSDTNISLAEALSLGIAFKGLDKDSITYYQLPGHGIIARDPLMDLDLFYYEPDMDGVRRIVRSGSLN